MPVWRAGFLRGFSELVSADKIVPLIIPHLINKTNAAQVDQTVNTLIPVVAALFPQPT
ncbi:hypothetical protein [Lapidilactobacillus luobeiensis]|uniref:hypothetical protein n=1 Tax=Lapidilactobacillus luobeiensis TaxID=2950371 RepID=UPI0021C46357|nr:hypothetical protein [Lapidilactobacillus luobeiensis]